MAERPIKILLVEDDDAIRRAMKRELSDLGFEHIAAPSAEAASTILRQQEIDVILLDINLPGMDGIAFFRTLKDVSDPPQVIILSGETSFEKAVEAMRLGAFDYQTKPPIPEMLNLVIRKAAEQRQLMRDLQRMRFLVERRNQVSRPLGKSMAFQRVLTLCHITITSDTPVLLLGETGAGKEVVAQYIHQISNRSHGPFVAINCAAIADNLLESELFGHEKGSFTGAIARKSGYFEAAEGGTLFLDEIGDMDLAMQAKLLRVVETGTFTPIGGTKPIRANVRIISATHRDLKKQSEAGTFRSDLYYRLQGFDISIPPLRDRVDDIPLLASHFLDRKNMPDPPITPRAIDALKAFPWPGNVRELSHVIEKARLMAQGATIDISHLPMEISGLSPTEALLARELPHFASASPQELPSSNAKVSLRELEKQYILKILKEQDGHQGQTAEILQISPRTLYRKLRQYEEEDGGILSKEDSGG